MIFAARAMPTRGGAASSCSPPKCCRTCMKPVAPIRLTGTDAWRDAGSSECLQAAVCHRTQHPGRPN
ncbi:hypothetical protein I553_5119 [Mycobacterium xenopi 4042]|uniref:Uncharacterized protein n=1 Tax=Mycobacterium xenopi 4042 TaxID=1299334 RepID=X7ZWB2_MYCXE|nr:hypothetical protein I553_5119 [Mycobacterium xenopi 4042]